MATPWWEWIVRQADRHFGPGQWKKIDIEKLTGTGRSVIGKWEQGFDPAPITIRRVAEAFHADILGAYVAAGWITEHEASVRVVPADLSLIDDEELLRLFAVELRRRLVGETAPEDRPVRVR